MCFQATRRDALAICAAPSRLLAKMDRDIPLFARHMDLVRAILFWAEDAGRPAKRPDVDRLKLCYHIKIMAEAGLIDGQGDYHRMPGTGRSIPA